MVIFHVVVDTRTYIQRLGIKHRKYLIENLHANVNCQLSPQQRSRV